MLQRKWHVFHSEPKCLECGVADCQNNESWTQLIVILLARELCVKDLVISLARELHEQTEVKQDSDFNISKSSKFLTLLLLAMLDEALIKDSDIWF